MRANWDKHAESIVIGSGAALLTGLHEYLSRYTFSYWLWLIKPLFWGMVLAGLLASIWAHRGRCLRPILWGVLAIILGGVLIPPIARETVLIPSLERRRAQAVEARKAGVDPPRDAVWDPENPDRIAFSEGGILNDWVGYVYDPTGVLRQENRVKGLELFNGNLGWAKPIGSGWYRCGFS